MSAFAFPTSALPNGRAELASSVVAALHVPAVSSPGITTSFAVSAAPARTAAVPEICHQKYEPLATSTGATPVTI